ncbi:hypothetical protein EHS25_000585 [Saitozyma podzolica]|uniref:Uncharacterized protein n=1 Tax=Saitozyma podzolica TaxID=1890683 RepID=A0A427YWH9_9TREE|nr:hypothetical protein EHS25_000585 [Saitozyma podzolica]
MTSPQPRIALVTGASSGIGRASAIALNDAGWIVVLTARRKDALEETIAMMGDKKHPKTLAVEADVAVVKDVERLFQVVKKEFGGCQPDSHHEAWPFGPALQLYGSRRIRPASLALTMQNAGMSSFKTPMEDLSLDHFEQVMRVNVTAPFLCSQLAVKIMKEQNPQGGRIINNGSISAYTPRPNAAPYTMSKHAISGLTKTLALDYRQYNIAACQIDVGNAQTSIGLKSDGMLQADGSMRPEPAFNAKYVGDAIVYMANLPLDVNILNQTIMATNMPFVGRG